jgi:hypothetical protein
MAPGEIQAKGMVIIVVHHESGGNILFENLFVFDHGCRFVSFVDLDHP